MYFQDARSRCCGLVLAVLGFSVLSLSASAELMLSPIPTRVEVELVGTREMQFSPEGLPYFVAPVSVTPDVLVKQTGDSSPVVEVDLNHQPYSPGVEVSEPGLHTIRATTIGRDGISTTESLTFQIRERPVHEARTLVEDFRCVEGAQGGRRIQGSLTLTSDTFDPSEINLSSIGIWPVSDSGEWMSDQPIRLRPSSRSHDTAIEFQQVSADFESCGWVIGFDARFAEGSLTACPAALSVTGRGLVNEPDAFDLVSQASTFPDSQQRRDLLDPDRTCKDPGDDPPGDDPVPCAWKIEPNSGPPAICSGGNGHPGNSCAWGHSLFLRVDGDRFSGKSQAFASGAGLGNFCSTGGIACSRANSMSYQVFQEGDDCCDECTIQFIAAPTFTAQAVLNPNGMASANGDLSVCSPCGCATASGSVTIDNHDEAFGSINHIPYVMPLVGGAASISPIGNMPPCTVNACSASVSIAASGGLSTQANTSLFNNYAQADAALKNADPGLQIKHSATCEEGEPPKPDFEMKSIRRWRSLIEGP